jgi:hypothetical protein
LISRGHGSRVHGAAMSDAIVAVIGFLGTATAAAIAAYAGTKHRIRAELEGQYDVELRNSRLKVYPELWCKLEPLAKYAREPPGLPKRKEIETLSLALRKWYFETGGLYLSAESRQAYFDLQDALTVVVTSERWKAAEVGDQVDADTFEALRHLGSWLRTTLTYDVGTRRRFSLAPEWQGQDDTANKTAIQEDLQAKDESARKLNHLRAAWGAPSGVGRSRQRSE